MSDRPPEKLNNISKYDTAKLDIGYDVIISKKQEFSSPEEFLKTVVELMRVHYPIDLHGYDLVATARQKFPKIDVRSENDPELSSVIEYIYQNPLSTIRELDENFHEFSRRYYQNKIASKSGAKLRKLADNDVNLGKIGVGNRALLQAWNFTSFVRDNFVVLESARRMLGDEKLEHKHYDAISKVRIDAKISQIVKNTQKYISLREILRQVSKAKFIMAKYGNDIDKLTPSLDSRLYQFAQSSGIFARLQGLNFKKGNTTAQDKTRMKIFELAGVFTK